MPASLSADAPSELPPTATHVEDADDDNDDEELANSAESGSDAAGAAKKNKKKKKKNKKAGTASAAQPAPVEQRPDGSIALDLSGARKTPHCLGLNPSVQCDSFTAKCKQTWPPTLPVEKVFEGIEPPVGEVLDHPGDHNRFRVTSEEMRAREHLMEASIRHIRLASECHRQVRKWAQTFIQPGIKIIEMCEAIEDRNRALVKENGLHAGVGFPTGCSLNHVAAHWTPNPGDQTILKYDDVMKVDFGTQIEGRIVDCAWTVAFNPVYEPLLKTVREATDTGVRASGIDVRLCDVGEAVQEVMEAGELELNGKTFRIKCCHNLNGHNIAPYQIHGGKSVPIVRGGEATRMEEGELYAIETFGTTGRGYVVEDLECSHYMKNFNAPHVPLRMPASAKLLGHINRTFKTLAFCRRWLERPDGGSFTVNGDKGKQERYMGALKNLCDVGLVSPYPPLCDEKGSFVAQ